MLTEYEAAMLTRQRAADASRPLAQAPSERNRLGAVLVTLSVLSAVALLYTAFFHRGPVSSAARVVPATTGAAHIIHPATSGLPEASLFLRERPCASEAHLPKVTAAAAGHAAPVQ